MQDLTKHLQSEKEQVTKSLQYWRNQFAEAERQIHIHTGHVERIDLLIQHLTQAENDTNDVEPGDESTL